MSRSDLPKFGNPPVVEVALSIMFETLPGIARRTAACSGNGSGTDFQ